MYLFCLCLFTNSGVQHILCICFVCVCLRIVVSNTYCVFVFVCVCLRIVVSNTYCVFVFLCVCVCFVYPLLPLSLDCLFLIAPSVFSNVYYTPTHREGAILQSPCLSVCPSVHTFVTDISASTGRNDFIFDIWLWHGDLYRVSHFQVYRTSTSCLPCDLEFFMFAVMKIFVTDISASTGRNDFIFDIWLWHGDLYRVPPFQVYCTSTSCLSCDLRIFHVFTTFSGNEC